MNRSAFTLIETMIAVLLMALFASAAALTFSRPLRRARSQDVVEQLRSFDTMSRLFASRHGCAVQIVFDLARNTLSRREKSHNASDSAITCSGGYSIEEVRTANRLASSADVAIDVSAAGLSRSYAVRLRGPEFDQWVLFAGLSGDMIQVQDEATIASLLNQCVLPEDASEDDAPRRHAD